MDVSRLSVVIACVNGYAPLAGCLAALARCHGAEAAQVIVVDRCRVAERVAAEFPWATVLYAERDATIPQMRSAGILASSGEWIIVTEDHCEPRSDWLERFAAHALGPYDVVAGSVENGRTAHLVDWAAFFTEYSEYAAPRASGETGDLPGMNTAYRRSALFGVPGLVQSAQWETFIHAALLGAGRRLYADGGIILDHCKSFGFWDFFTQRFHLARSFAGMRVRGAPASRRAVYGLLAPALIAILPTRIVGKIWRKGRNRRELVLCLPLLAVFLASWTVGEWVGYWFGEGDSSSKVE